MAAAAVALAPVAALAVEPKRPMPVIYGEQRIGGTVTYAMGGTIAPGTASYVGEFACETILTQNQVREMEDAWENRWTGIPAHEPYIINFNPAALLRGDAKPHQA
jgi:hypothetical protein